MYIKYNRTQREIWKSNGEVNMTAGITNRLKASEEISEFKPTWLVRVSDMQVVPGSSVKGHYWTVSYSWNQSGEIIQTGAEEYDRIDEGKHTIIPKRKKKQLGNHNKQVTFDGLVQQMCLDFGIEYVWLDQKCINQGDHDEKMREIKRMHLIYKNSRCTLAIIPELEFTGKKDGENIANTEVLPNSQWSRRIWTLEEAYMSRRILFVGRNVHLWLNFIKMDDWDQAAYYLKNIRVDKKWRACTALWYASTRTSSKTHDRIFALVNIFPELKDSITFSYKQPVIDLMTQFYGLLAKNDISILVFGLPNIFDTHDEILAKRQEEARLLPSWSGASGIHISRDHFLGEFTGPTVSWTITGDCMSVTSDFIHVRLEAVTSIETVDPATDDSKYCTKDGLPRSTAAVGICVTENGSKDMTFVSTTSELREEFHYNTATYGIKATHFLPTKSERQSAVAESQLIINTLSRPTDNSGFLSLVEECSECIILTGISFHGTMHRCLPVITKDKEDCYKSIGVCLLPIYIDPGFFVQSSQSFLIK